MTSEIFYFISNLYELYVIGYWLFWLSQLRTLRKINFSEIM